MSKIAMNNYPSVANYNDNCVTPIGEQNDPNCPKSVASEVREIYVSELDPENLGRPKYFPADPTSAASFATAVESGLKKFKVMGSMPQPAENVIQKGSARIQLPRVWQIIVNHIDTSVKNYDLARTFQNGGEIYVWVKTFGNRLVGATPVSDATDPNYWPYGIRVHIRNWHPDNAEGSNSVENILTTLEWDAIQAPPKMESPI